MLQAAPALLLVALTGHLWTAHPQAAKAPPPDLSAQQAAEALIKDLFKEDYARKNPADRVALAVKLIEKARENTAESAERFVLWREARELAVQQGEVELAFKALAGTNENFQVDEQEMASDALAALAKTVRGPDAMASLARAFLDFSRLAARHADYKAATRAAGDSGTLARKAGDVVLGIQADVQAEEVSAIQREQQAVKPALQSLESGAEDPTASLAAGRFFCFFLGDFARGLPFLAKGASGDLKESAARDLAGPKDETDLVAAGDGWWEISEKEKGLAKAKVRERACYWYEKAIPAMSGLARARVEKRVAQRLSELRPQTYRSEVSGRAGNDNLNNTYNFDIKPQGKKALLRFWATSSRKMDSNGDVFLTGPGVRRQSIYHWSPRDFKLNSEAVSTYQDLKPFNVDISKWVSAAGAYSIHFQFKDGRDALYILRVEVLIY